jgi:2,4-dienoyl-CoA reductase-like NADH-dependent reductase (Old Yellow Enzyme family)
MTKLSDTLTIRGKVIKNRITSLPVVNFTFPRYPEAYFGQRHLEHYTAVAEGGAGIVYVQGTDVKGVLEEAEQWTPASKRTLLKITDVIHKNGALAMIQLSWGGDTVTDLNALTTEEVLRKQEELLAAAIAVGELGFDGFEFHFGHTFLLCKVLDAEANKRTDRFGGSLEKRASIITDIIPKIRELNGADFILAVRMGAELPTREIAVETARYLELSGIDILNITHSMMPPMEAPAGFPLSGMVYGGSLIHEAVTIPVIGVGGINNKEDADLLLDSGYADIVGVARAILADYDWPKKVLAGEPVDECLRCKDCFWFSDDSKCPARLIAKVEKAKASASEPAPGPTVLERRIIEIELANAFVDVIRQRWDEETANDVLREVVKQLAHTAAEGIRAKNPERSLNSLWDVWGGLGGDGRLDMVLDELSEKTLKFHIDRCSYEEAYRKMGLEELGVDFSCRRDKPFAEALMPGIRMRQSETIMEGSKRCAFEYSLDD